MLRGITMALTRREAGQRYAAAAALVLSDLMLCAGCGNATTVEIQDSEEITEPYSSMADLVVFSGFSGSGFHALEQSGYTLLESRDGSGTPPPGIKSITPATAVYAVMKVLSAEGYS